LQLPGRRMLDSGRKITYTTQDKAYFPWMTGIKRMRLRSVSCCQKAMRNAHANEDDSIAEKANSDEKPIPQSEYKETSGETALLSIR
jgi:hypothetical protein